MLLIAALLTIFVVFWHTDHAAQGSSLFQSPLFQGTELSQDTMLVAVPNAILEPNSPLLAPGATPEPHAHVITDSNFATVWAASAKTTVWNVGLPAPDTGSTSQNIFNTIAAGTTTDFSQPVDGGGWRVLYRNNFNGAFVSSGRNGSCSVKLLSNKPAYQWGVDSFRSVDGDGKSLWLGKGGTSGATFAAGTNTYPTSLVTQYTCTLVGISAVKDLMINFAMWMDAGNDGDTFFAGFSTDGTNYKGRRWRNSTKLSGSYQWVEQHLYFMNAGVKAAPNGGKLTILFEFRSDATNTTAKGVWIDRLSVLAGPNDSPDACAKLDVNPQLAVPGVPGGAKVTKGLNVNPRFESADGEDNDIARIDDTNSTRGRIEFKVSNAQRASAAGLPTGTGQTLNNIDYQLYDRVINKICGKDIAVLGLIDYASLADSSWEGQSTIPDAYRESFKQVAKDLVTRYKNQIRYCEVWNEPDLVSTRLEPAGFAKLLLGVYPTIKAADSNAKVVSGGLASADGNAGIYSNSFVREVNLQRGSNPTPYDIFGIHPYVSDMYKDANGKIIVDPTIYLHKESPTLIKKFQDHMKLVERDKSPIWITEIGWNRALFDGSPETRTCDAVKGVLVSHAQQAFYLKSSFDVLFKETGWDANIASITRIFWYQYQDTGLDLDCDPPQIAHASASDHLVYQISVSAAGPNVDVRRIDWWFGLYGGTDTTTPVPEAHGSQCVFKQYGRADSREVEACFRFAYLPLIVGGGTTGQ